MPSTLFDSAGLAIVAYAQVDGHSGNSANTTTLASSGVSTTKISTGLYQVLPADQPRAGQLAGPDLRPAAGPAHHDRHPTRVRGDRQRGGGERLGQAKVKLTGASGLLVTTAIDSDFDVLVLRTIPLGRRPSDRRPSGRRPSGLKTLGSKTLGTRLP